MTPVIVASLMGLFHALGYTLLLTVALITGEWQGERTWCNVAHVAHKHIVFSTVYCTVLNTVEVTRNALLLMYFKTRGNSVQNNYVICLCP